MGEEKRTTREEARRVGDEIGVDWGRFELEQFRIGMDVEYEHGAHDPQTDVTGDDPILVHDDLRRSVRPQEFAVADPTLTDGPGLHTASRHRGRGTLPGAEVR